ncbi:MAG: hypothetical protein KJO07_05600, partial [Deltaproteobacteria bacterium]|nr:hypothetical protein [Deltaproteobacteria bacterium]
MRAVLAVILTLSLSACTGVDPFQCFEAGDCSSAGALCQPDGFCSSPDDSCNSGYRYDDSAESELAGQCVRPTGPGTITDPSVRAVTGVRHSGSSQFTVEFDGIIEANVVVTVDTERDEHWQIASQSVGTQTTWVVELDGYPIPIDHTVTIEQIDPDGVLLDSAEIVLSGSEIGNRLMFATAASGTGNLLSWSALPGGSSAATGLEAADEICQSEASAAGLAGSYRALLTTETADLQCRLAGLSGDYVGGSPCGQATAPALGPWIMSTGVP